MKKNQLVFYGLVMELIALELVLIYAGRWVDEKHKWNGIGVALGCFLGLMIWVFHMFKALKQLEKDENNQS